jgi:hypothetical protein
LSGTTGVQVDQRAFSHYGPVHGPIRIVPSTFIPAVAKNLASLPVRSKMLSELDSVKHKAGPMKWIMSEIIIGPYQKMKLLPYSMSCPQIIDNNLVDEKEKGTFIPLRQ